MAPLPLVREEVAREVRLQKSPSDQTEMANLYRANPPSFDMAKYGRYFSDVPRRPPPGPDRPEDGQPAPPDARSPMHLSWNNPPSARRTGDTPRSPPGLVRAGCAHAAAAGGGGPLPAGAGPAGADRLGRRLRPARVGLRLRPHRPRPGGPDALAPPPGAARRRGAALLRRAAAAPAGGGPAGPVREAVPRVAGLPGRAGDGLGRLLAGPGDALGPRRRLPARLLRLDGAPARPDAPRQHLGMQRSAPCWPTRRCTC